MKRYFMLALCAVLSAVPAGAYTVKGTVIDAAGHPVAGATVWMSQERVVRKTGTDVAGAFTFSDVEVGNVEVVARREGLALDGLDAQVVGDADITLTLGPPDSLPVKVINQAHEPVVGARIAGMFVGDRFHVSVEDLASAGFPPMRSNDKGLLLIDELPQGSYVSFSIAHRDYAEHRFPPIPVKPKEFPVILYPGVKVRGRVLNEEKKPVEHARVSLFSARVEGLREFTEVLTDPEGFYNATVPPGEYFVAVHHSAYASSAPKPIRTTDSDENVLDLQLENPHLVEGSVIGPDCTPAAGVTVAYCVQKAMREQALTTADGTYRLRLPVGQGQVRVLPPDGYIAEIPVGLPVSVTTEASIVLAPLRLKALPEIVGVVYGADKAPVPDALISSLDLRPPVWALTDQEGRFRIRLSRVPFEQHARFRAEHGLRFLRKDFDVAFDNPVPLTVDLEQFNPDIRPARREYVTNNLASLVDKPAPAIACRAWVNANPVSLDDLHGKVVVLTLWGGFDAIGRGNDRMTELVTLHRLLREAADVAFVAVHDGGSEPDEVKRYVDRYGITFPVGVDAEPFVTFDHYDTSFIPQTVLIDKKGVLRFYEVDGRLLELIKSLRRED